MAIMDFNDGWYVRPPRGPFSALESSEVEVKAVTVPHDAMRDMVRTPESPSRGSSAYYPSAAFTYLKSVFVPEEWLQKLVFLEFGGVMRHAQVFVNEDFVGNRADGYSRFFIDLTPYIHVGENDIRVEARTEQDSRWYTGAGLYRGVKLHVLDPVHIIPDGVRVTTIRLEESQAVIEVAVSVRNAGMVTSVVRVRTDVAEANSYIVDTDDTPLTIPPGTTQLVRHRLYIKNPRLWGPEHPSLYSAKISLNLDDPVTVQFGIRTITVDPHMGLRINSEPVLLRGACLHHDNGPLGASAIPRAEERRIELLKEAGFNAIRSAHNPASEALLQACDRLGMLVMDEAFDVWVRFKSPYDYSMDFPQWWREDIDSMVAKDYNHPSVILYSIGNEIAEVGSPHGSVLARDLAERIRSLDPTRFVTNAVSLTLVAMDELSNTSIGVNELLAGNLVEINNTLSSGNVVTQRIEESSSVLDVVGLNYAEVRYSSDAERFPHQVIVGSETFGSRIGILWPMVQDLDNVIGDFTWTGWDYLGEVGLGAIAYVEDTDNELALVREFPFLTAQCGDFDITGYRRPISYYRETAYGLRTIPYLAVQRPEHHGDTIAQQSPWAWSDSICSWTWSGYEGKPVIVEVYSDADEVVLNLNGQEVSRSIVGSDKPLLALFDIVYIPGKLEAISYKNGVESGRCSVETASPVTCLHIKSDRDTLSPTPDDLAFLSIELCDELGRLVTDYDQSITVEVFGQGILAGMCSANPKTEERFDSATWKTFDGRALAVIRPIGEGTITVKTSADDLPPVITELIVKGTQP